MLKNKSKIFYKQLHKKNNNNNSYEKLTNRKLANKVEIDRKFLYYIYK